MQRLVAEVGANPQRHRRFDPPARRHFTKWFPYVVICLEQPDLVWIAAIMHLKRHRGYWKHRLAT